MFYGSRRASVKRFAGTAGVETVTWSVELVKDDDDEPTEKFKILLRTPTNALLGEVDRAIVHLSNVANGRQKRFYVWLLL